MDVSIVIPVYNAEKYVKRCVESVISSLGRKIHGEILLIDNNSSDGSLDILKELHTKYPKIIQILHCKTPGAAAVRNYGVDRARGDYLWFIDADDKIAADAIPKLLEAAKKADADLVMMGATRVYSDHTDYLSAVDAATPDYKSRFIRYGMGPWQVLIRKKWWVLHGFKFREGIIQEDMELMSALILYSDKFASVNEPLYFYYQNNNSVLHKKDFDPKIFDIFPALTGLYKRFKEAGAEVQYHDELEWFFIWNLLIDSAKDFGRFPEGRSGFSRSREMLNEYFPNWRKNKFLREKPLKLKLRIKLNFTRNK